MGKKGKKQTDGEKLNELSSLMRKSSTGQIEDIFTHGGCYKFYEIAKLLFPSAEAWYDGDHVVVKLDGTFHDINGTVSDTENFIPIDGNYTEGWVETAKGWKYDGTDR